MTYLKQLLKKLDLCCLQEHWLFKPEQHLLHDIDTNMIVTAKSIDDENPELSMIARRGYGGVAILWKKEMDDKISVMVDGSNRIQVIQMETDNTPLFLINVYMPSDNKDMDNEYKDTLAQMTEIIKTYRNTHDILLCGDLNGSIHRSKTSHDPLLKKFLAENSLELNQEYPEKKTFFHHNGKSSGQIDYFFSASEDLTQYVQILDMEAENTSDHVPVIATIKEN
ncbi:E3.1.11.2 [Mytilus coruscus]|uniref:exodeoxyribonuclease III n=1 Tax=Mytilus coruscus TaxID=42192 RepID=A0A6J8EH46_MYTCO|nr:E3.1.11.2 [Mytilus coruscus]